MASEKTASVKLTLNNASYLISLKQIGKESEKVAKQQESAFKSSMIAGLKGAKGAVADLASSAKNTIKVLGGIGAGMSVAEAAKAALDIRGQFKGIAFDVKAGSGEVVDFTELMKGAQEQAVKWGIATEDLAGAFRIIRDETGNVNLAKESLAAVASTARATGAPVDTLATIAGKLNEKFGVTGEQMPEALAAVFSLSKKGGIQLDEMAAAIDRAGSSAKLMGIQGVAGFQRIMGMANLAKGDAKNVRGALMGVMGLLEDMAKPEMGKKLGATFGVMTKDAKGHAKDVMDVLGKIFLKTGGKQELLARGFEGEQLKIVTDLGQVFKTTFETTSGTVKERTAAALAAYRRTLDESGQTQLKAADIQAQAAKKMESPSAQLAKAQEELKKAFTSPQMMEGLLKLAQLAPRAADRLAKLVNFAMDHPLLASGIVLGMKGGSAFLKSALEAAAPSVGSAIKAALTSSAVSSAAGAAGSAGAAAAGGGAAAAGGSAVAAEGAAAGAATAAGAGSLLAAGIGALAMAPAAAMAYLTVKKDAEGEKAATTLIGDTTASPENKLANIRAMIDRAQKNKEATARVLKGGNTDALENRAARDMEAAGMARKLDALKAEEARLTGEAAQQTVKGFNMVDDAARRFADRLDRMIGREIGAPNGPGAAYRGPPRVTPPAPGYAR